MRKLEKAWQAKFWKFNRFIARVLLLWLFWRTLLILSLWLSLCLKYFDKRSETFPVVICWYAAAGDTAICYALPALWPTSGLHCSNCHEYFHWLNYFLSNTIFFLVDMYTLTGADHCMYIFSFSLQGELWTRTVAISHVFSLIIMMLVSVYIMDECAALDTGDSGDISHVVILPIVTFAISTLFIATLFGQAAGWLETTHSGFHSMTFLLERLFSK